MWEYFVSACAFCGGNLKRSERKGHADHLVAASQGGRNHIFNRVLACSTCNGDEKLDADWVEFLKLKVEKGDLDEAECARRRKSIEEWQAMHQAECTVEDDDLAAALFAADDVLKQFDEACKKVRGIRDGR